MRKINPQHVVFRRLTGVLAASVFVATSIFMFVPLAEYEGRSAYHNLVYQSRGDAMVNQMTQVAVTPSLGACALFILGLVLVRESALARN